MTRFTWLVVALALTTLTAATCNKSNTGGDDKPLAQNGSGAGTSPTPQAADSGAGKPDESAKVLADVPGMDFSMLSPPAKRELATVFSDEFCYCGCPHTLGACLKTHTNCKHARRMALLAATEASSGTPAVEIINALGKYYQSFQEPRATFKVDPRMCMGKADAKVTLVEFSDFECPFCAAARPLLEELVKARSDARLCYLPFPLSGHANAIPAGQAALFARDNGKFWPMHDLLFENQTTLNPASIKQLAASLGLSAAELGKAMDSGKYLAELNASKEQGKAAKVDATPAIYVNGRKYNLSLTSEMLNHTIDDELERLSANGSWAAD
jgi:protein-disulfide isomerase